MLRPEDNRFQTELFSLLNTPAMLHRGTNPFGIDLARNSLAGLSTFPSNKLTLSSVGMGVINALNQFPPQRIHGSLHQGAPDMQSPLGMLSEMAAGDKRMATDDFQRLNPKRQKLSSDNPNLLKDNPKLLERLSSMSGGFPGPKWGYPKKAKSKSESPTQERKALSTPGAFPMPALPDGRVKDMSRLSLTTYRELWKDTDIDLREEVLARKLEQKSCKISQRKYNFAHRD